MTIVNSFVYEFDTEQAENTKCAERQKFRLKQKNIEQNNDHMQVMRKIQTI